MFSTMLNEKIKVVFHENKNMNEYIAKIEIPIPKGPPEFIFIIDSSGSMLGFFEIIIKNIIPGVLKKLEIEQEKIHLITFSDKINYYNLSIDELINSNLEFGGDTYMSGVYDKLEDIFKNFKERNKDIRIFTISDGVIFDQKETKEKGDNFFNKYSQKNFTINSQCLRLKTSDLTDPDTEALCSFLRLTTKENLKAEIISCNYSNDNIFDKNAEFWAEVVDYEESEDAEEKEEKSEEEKKLREDEKKKLNEKVSKLYEKHNLVYDLKKKLNEQSDDFIKKLNYKMCETINIPLTEDIYEIRRQYNKNTLLENQDNLINQIYKLFKEDGLGKEGLFKISSNFNDIREIPWENGKNSGKLSSGSNTIWLSEIKNLSIQNELDEEVTFDMVEGQKISKNNYLEIISEDKITYIVQKTILNKVINTKDTNEENKKASEYFTKFEQNLYGEDEVKQKLLVTGLIEDVINSDIKNLDNNQIANYIKEKTDKIEQKLKKRPSKKYSFILVIDSSNTMKSNINNFIQNILYNSLIKLGYIKEDLINIFAFSNKIKQYTIAVEDLPEFKIKIKDDTSERKLSDIFNLIAKIILKDLETEYKLLFIFSGKISDEDSTQLKAYDLANSLKNTAKIESNVIQYNINNQKNDKSNDINKETNYVLRNISSIDINIESPIYEINTNDSNEDKINKIVSIFSNEKNTKTKSNNSSNLSNSIPNFVNSSNSSNKDNFKSIVMDSDMDENILENPNNEEKKFRFIDNIRDKLYKAFNNCNIF